MMRLYNFIGSSRKLSKLHSIISHQNKVTPRGSVTIGGPLLAVAIWWWTSNGSSSAYVQRTFD